MRRQTRAETREKGRTTRPDVIELVRIGEWLRGELRNEARHRMPSPEQVAEVRTILEQALADVRRVLSEPPERD
jgi:hypothetical protein